MYEAGVGDSDSVQWENQSWVILSNSTDNFLFNSNSENSAGGGDEGVEKSGEKEKEMMEKEDLVQQEVELAVAPGKKTLAKKRGGQDCDNGAMKHERKAAKGKGKGSRDEVVEGKRRGGDSEDDHELHIYTERERRKKMRNMFSNLHALLPQLPSKADKSSIVAEAVSYIKKVEVTLHSLQQQKKKEVDAKFLT